MMSKFVVLAVLIVAAYGQATANDCNGASCGTSDSNCMFGQRCCSGKCYWGIPATQGLGAACTVPATCGNQCISGLTCTNSVCTLPATIGTAGCSTACSVDADCVSGACIGTTCGAKNLLPGAACSATNLCTSGFSCVSSVCTASANGAACMPLTGVYDYSQTTLYTWASNCTKTSFCNVTNVVGLNSPVCAALIANSQPAHPTLLAASCASGVYQPGVNLCIAANSLSNGATCNNDNQCPTASYCSTTCIAKNQLAVGATCSRYTQNDQCVTSAFCSLNSTTGASNPSGGTYTCVTGTKFGLAAAASCWNNDQCGLGMNCTYTGSPTTLPGVCTSVLGQPCVPASAGVPATFNCLAANQAVGTNSLGCYCSGTSYVCTTPAAPAATTCGTQYNAIVSLAQSGGFGGVASYMTQIMAAGTDANRATIYAWYCCLGCASGLSVIAPSANVRQQTLSLAYNCKTGTYGALSSSDTTTRCAKSQTVPIAIANLLGTCSSGNSGAASVLSPSLALLFSIVALVFLL